MFSKRFAFLFIPVEWPDAHLMLFCYTNRWIIWFTSGKRFVVIPEQKDFMPVYLSTLELKTLLGEQQKRRDSLRRSRTQLLLWGRNICEPTRRVLVAEASLMGVPVMQNDSFGESISIWESPVCVQEMLCWLTAECWKQSAWQSFISQTALCCWGSSCMLAFLFGSVFSP